MAFPIDQSVDSTSPEHQQLKAGQRVFNGRYELKEKLGAGGMGVVWLAHDLTEKTDVALKFLPTVLVQHDREMDRLREEVRAGKDLRHPLIVATYAMEVAGGMAAIVLEYVSGLSLKQRLEASACGFLEPAEVDGWLRDIASALTYLHNEKKRLHRDLKPANIIVDRNGRARLMDFGISQSIQETLGRHSQTNQSHGTSNTLAYASPESLRLRHRPAIADDIYGLGATLYDLLTGTPPFYQGRPEVIALHIKTEPVPSVAERRQELVEDGMNKTVGEPVPAQWDQAVASCLAKDSKDRPASVDALMLMLMRAAAPEPEVPQAIPPVPPAPPKDVRNEVSPGDDASEETKRIPVRGAPAALKTTPVLPMIEDGAVGKVISFTLPGDVEMKFCYCPAGEFLMGSPVTEEGRGELEHQGLVQLEEQVPVQITHGFWLAQTECTQGQWQALMGSNPSEFAGSWNLPVEQVNWHDAQSLITKLNEVVRLPAGWLFSLPTEAQWEYACRAGKPGVFSFGDTLTGLQANMNGHFPYPSTSTSRGFYLRNTAEVASYPPNAWGLYDMHGNVWEWCQDAWDGASKPIGGRNPVSKMGSYRVCRGGSWDSYGVDCRSAYRGWDDPQLCNNDLGFRVALVPMALK